MFYMQLTSLERFYNTNMARLNYYDCLTRQ